MTEKDKRELLNYLSKHKLMSLGTNYKIPWAASVYYLCSDDFNFYFVSDPQTRHCKNIAKTPKVSITVADSRQKSSDKKIGFQAWGEAKRITNLKEIPPLVKAWNKRGFVPMTLKLITKVWKSRFYKIRLKEVQIFDENQTGDKEVRTWKILNEISIRSDLF